MVNLVLKLGAPARLRQVREVARSAVAALPPRPSLRCTVVIVGHVPSNSRPPPALAAAIGVVAIAIIAGLVALWPGEVEPPKDARVLRRGAIVSGTVTKIELSSCGGAPEVASDSRGPLCRRITARVSSGPDEGITTTIEFPDLATSPDLQVGEGIKLERPPVEIPGVPYVFFDRVRGPALIWLAVLFAGLVVLLARIKGIAALVGLALSIGLIMAFILPAILEGSSPLLVASVGAGAIAFIVLYLAHGYTSMTSVALVGTLLGIAVTLGLSLVFTPLAKLAGLASETT